MTGYGSSLTEDPGLKASVSVRSLNHRFFELSVKVSCLLQPLEADIKELVQAQVRRGRVDLQVQATVPEGTTAAVLASRPAVAGLVSALRQLQNDHGLEGGVTVSDVARFPGVLEAVESPLPLDDARKQRILDLVQQALLGLVAMRRAEGSRLQSDLERALMAILEAAERIETLSFTAREAQTKALQERVRVLVQELGLDDGRLYQEVVRAVERHDVSEELQRLKSHVAMARDLLEAREPAGRRLDFLAQELMREANTVGSKTQDKDLAREVVGLKAEVEKLREQVQNVE
jgi:uncharacterized protein (TIGR00255 family)